LDARTVIRPLARSTSRQRSAHSSLMRRPEKVSVASVARRASALRSSRASRSSSPAASSSAVMWTARSSHGRGAVGAFRRRRLPRAGLRAMNSQDQAGWITRWCEWAKILGLGNR
jgi:hypothetical protein